MVLTPTSSEHDDKLSTTGPSLRTLTKAKHTHKVTAPILLYLLLHQMANIVKHDLRKDIRDTRTYLGYASDDLNVALDVDERGIDCRELVAKALETIGECVEMLEKYMPTKPPEQSI